MPVIRSPIAAGPTWRPRHVVKVLSFVAFPLVFWELPDARVAALIRLPASDPGDRLLYLLAHEWHRKFFRRTLRIPAILSQNPDVATINGFRGRHHPRVAHMLVQCSLSHGSIGFGRGYEWTSAAVSSARQLWRRCLTYLTRGGTGNYERFASSSFRHSGSRRDLPRSALVRRGEPDAIGTESLVHLVGAAARPGGARRSSRCCLHPVLLTTHATRHSLRRSRSPRSRQTSRLSL